MISQTQTETNSDGAPILTSELLHFRFKLLQLRLEFAVLVLQALLLAVDSVNLFLQVPDGLLQSADIT